MFKDVINNFKHKKARYLILTIYHIIITKLLNLYIQVFQNIYIHTSLKMFPLKNVFSLKLHKLNYKKNM